jgi:hypothetical protein
VTLTRNDYDGEIPEKHAASLFQAPAKGDARMNANDRNLQHAMMSFALWGGMLVNPKSRQGASDRVVSRPSNFIPIKLDRHRD